MLKFTIVEVGLVVNLPLFIGFLGGGVLKIFYFHPEPWGKKCNLTNIFFLDGWLNHQLVMAFHYTAWFIGILLMAYYYHPLYNWII